jgi:hypothetical protein
MMPRGQEQPFGGRLHLTLDARAGSVEAGDVQVDDRRAEVSVAYAPSETVLLTLGVPALSRTILSPAGSLERTSLGDVELGLHVVRVTRFEGGLIQRFGVFAALKLPTAPLEHDASGVVLSSVLQPGCGSLVPAAGADYVVSKGVLAVYGGASLWLPFAVREGPHAGESLRANVGAQWQPLRTVALRAGTFARLDAAGTLPGDVDDPNSGGLVGYAAGSVVVTPLTDFTVEAGVLYPALQLLRGEHREGAIAALTLGVDL